MKLLRRIWWNTQVIFSRLIYDPLLLDFLEVLPPNDFTWELSKKEKIKQKLI